MYSLSQHDYTVLGSKKRVNNVVQDCTLNI